VRYDAFISYSHAADDALAPALQRGLQNLARPWNRRRALEIFRDDTGLAVSPGLWTSICAGLDESDYFVLLASPEAAASVWVNREIDHWIASHSVDNLLPVVTDGDWVWDSTGDFDWSRSTAVPPALRGLFTEEPRHLDLHWARTENELDLRSSRFRQAVAQLAAPMHSMTPQDLDSADVANHRQVVRLRRAVGVAMAILLILVSAAGVLAIRNARESNRQQALALQNAENARVQAQLATALRLVAEAKTGGDRHKTVSLLLSVEASLRAPDQAWGSLVDSLRTAPGLDRVFDLPTGIRQAVASAVAPTGDMLAAPNNAGDIQLWDLSTGHASGAPLNADLFPKSPSELMFGQTGLLAARYDCTNTALCTRTAALNSQIEIWDPGRGRGQRLPGSDGFGSLAFSADGRELAAYSSEGRVRVWDAGDGTILATTRSVRGDPSGVALDHDASRLALATTNPARIYSWPVDRSHLEERRTIWLSSGQRPDGVAFGKGDLLVTLDKGGLIRMWNAKSGRRLRTPAATSGQTFVDFAFGPDGTFATADTDGSLRIWNGGAGTQLGTSHSAGATRRGLTLAFTSGGLVSVGADVRLWDVRHWDQSASPLYMQPGGVTSMAVSPTGLLASGGSDGDIVLSTVGTDSPDRTLHARQGAVTALAMRSDGTLVSGGSDGTVRLWNTATGRPVQTLPSARQGSVATLAFSRDGADLAIGYRGTSSDSTSHAPPIRVWDLGLREVDPLDAGLAEDVSAVAFGSEQMFATAGEDHLTVYESPTGETRVLAQYRGARFAAIAFSPDGKTFASSGYRDEQTRGNTAALWEVPVQPEKSVPLSAGHAPGWDGRFLSLAFSPDSSLLAGAGQGGVQLWDVGRAAQLGGLLRPLGGTAIVFSPDGESVIVSDESGLVQAYPATIDGWRDAACAVVSRNLTEGEWATFVGVAEPYRKTCPQY
jgi:WD40 repeat protein